MPKRVILSSTGRQEIELKIDEVFDRLLTRFLGPYGGKSMYFGIFDSTMSLPGLFTAAASSSGAATPDEEVRKMVATVARNYIEGERAKAKAKIIQEVETAVSASDKEPADAVMDALGGRLSELWGSVTTNVHKIVEAESAGAKNEGYKDGIVRMTQSLGIEDPTVFKVVVKDDVTCDVCKYLWLMPDQVTPRLWKLSELGHGYTDHKDPQPSVLPQHPHCRCELTTLLPGFGFSAGRVAYVAQDHDELSKQRGE